MDKTLWQYEVFSTARNTGKGLAAEVMISPPGEDEPQMRIFSHFSRVKISLTEAGQPAIWANIPIDEWKLIAEKAERAFRSVTKDSGTGESPAYTVSLTAGKYKGKTPAEVLSSGDEAGLKSHREWLAQNLDRYPRNKTAIDAIDDAIALSAKGQLQSVKGREPVVLYSADMRPLVRRVREDGKAFVYTIRILVVEVNGERTVDLQMQNYYAPVIKTPDGRLNVRTSERDEGSSRAALFSLTEQEWYRLTAHVEWAISAGVAAYGPACLRSADALSRTAAS